MFRQSLSLTEGVRAKVKIVAARVVISDKSFDGASAEFDVKSLFNPAPIECSRGQKAEAVRMNGPNLSKKLNCLTYAMIRRDHARSL